MILLPSVALAVPLELAHTGRLLDTNGVPFTGPHDLDVALYGSETGTDLIWSDSLTGVDFDAGYFTVLLGTGSTALDDSVLDGTKVWLGVAVDSGPEGSRTPVTSVPYAIRARTSINVEGGTVDATSISVGGSTVIDSSGVLDVAEVRVGGSTVIDGSGTFTGTDTLTGLGCTIDQVALFDGTDWVCSAQAADWNALINVPAEFADGDDDELTETEVEDFIANGNLAMSGILSAPTASFQTLRIGSSSICGAGSTGTLSYENDVVSVCTSVGWLPLGDTSPGTPANPVSSCLTLHNIDAGAPSGPYWIDPTSSGAPFPAYCDMVTDGGGWTIVYGATGVDGEQPLVSNITVDSDPLTFAHYNIPRSRKEALSAISTESIFVRDDATWLKADRAMFDATLSVTDSNASYPVTLTANDGTSVAGNMGWSNYNIDRGGDFHITDPGGVDNHSTNYWHLNSGCQGHHLYSYSNTTGDGDAGYDVRVPVGTWATTVNCDTGEGGSLVFYAGMR